MADDLRPIFIPRILGWVDVHSSALAIAASSAGGSDASTCRVGGVVEGLLSIDASNPNILVTALQ